MRFLPHLLGRTEVKSAEIERAAQGPRYISWGVPTQPTTWDLNRIVQDGYERVIWLWRGVDAIASRAASLEVKAVSGDASDFSYVQDPILERLNKGASPWERAYDFRYRLSSQLILSKAGVFVEVVRGRLGGVGAISLLNPQQVRIVPDPDLFISAFEITLSDGSVSFLPPFKAGASDTNSVLWVRKPHPTDPYSGTTPLEAAGISIDLDFWARLYNRTFMQNDGRPGGILAVRGELSNEDAEELKRRFSGGPTQSGRTTVLEADDVSWVDTATSPRDAQYVESRAITKEEILLALGVPETIIGNASGRTYDNADAEREVFWTETMPGHLATIERAFDLLTEGGDSDDIRLWHDTSNIEVLKRAAERRSEVARSEFQSGLISADEYRTMTGRDPVDRPGSTVLWMAAGKVPVGEGQEQAAASAPAQGEPKAVVGATLSPDSSELLGAIGAVKVARLGLGDSASIEAADLPRLPIYGVVSAVEPHGFGYKVLIESEGLSQARDSLESAGAEAMPLVVTAANSPVVGTVVEVDGFSVSSEEDEEVPISAEDVKRIAEATLLALEAKYDPSQPRDEMGRWSRVPGARLPMGPDAVLGLGGGGGGAAAPSGDVPNIVGYLDNSVGGVRSYFGVGRHGSDMGRGDFMHHGVAFHSHGLGNQRYVHHRHGGGSQDHWHEEVGPLDGPDAAPIEQAPAPPRTGGGGGRRLSPEEVARRQAEEDFPVVRVSGRPTVAGYMFEQEAQGDRGPATVVYPQWQFDITEEEWRPGRTEVARFSNTSDAIEWARNNPYEYGTPEERRARTDVAVARGMGGVTLPEDISPYHRGFPEVYPRGGHPEPVEVTPQEEERWANERNRTFARAEASGLIDALGERVRGVRAQIPRRPGQSEMNQHTLDKIVVTEWHRLQADMGLARVQATKLDDDALLAAIAAANDPIKAVYQAEARSRGLLGAPNSGE